ncbi:MAG TPA: SPFH domain-containing protein [Steroidobacteraceae bacterium]|nr:SPFH domain-containing protein [Steroidobacteraceae bacterium]
MSNDRPPAAINEKAAHYLNGWIAVIIGVALIVFLARNFVGQLGSGDMTINPLLSLGAAILVLILMTRGLVTLEPKQAVVLTFFGKYAGTIRNDGLWFYNPFCARRKLSLRVVNTTTPTLKVNDLAGNPVEVAAIVVWAVEDTARASFAVEYYERFLAQQAESALRQVVGGHPYDSEGAGEGLRGNMEGVSTELERTIGSHAAAAGIAVLDARLAHLAYAPEIAGVMLRRQQAEAVLAARRKIVEGAVGLVTHAVEALSAAKIAVLNDAQRAQLVINLMTMLVAETDAQPVVPMTSAVQ